MYFNLFRWRSGVLYHPVCLICITASVLSHIGFALEISARAAPARTASSKTAETSSTPSIVIPTTISTPTAASHQVAEEKEYKADVAGFNEKEENQQDDRSPKDQLCQTELNGLGLAVILMNGLPIGERNPGVCGDDLCDLAHTQRYRRVVVSLLCSRYHRTTDVANLGIVENALQSVADLNSSSPRLHDEDYQNAAVSSLRTNLPFVLELGGELFDGLVVIESLDGDDSDLSMRLAVNL